MSGFARRFCATLRWRLSLQATLSALAFTVLASGTLAQAPLTSAPKRTAALPSSGEAITCESNATHPGHGGLLRNNTWNQQAAGKAPWKQCLVQRQLADGKKQFGWSWAWPQKHSLYAYPEITVGSSPWLAGPAKADGFPRRVADLRRMTVRYDLDVQAQGLYNVAGEMWLTSAPPADGKADESLIVAELMITTGASPGMPPDPKPSLGEVVIDGQRWKIHAHKGWGAETVTGHRWTFITYDAQPPMSLVRYDARRILDDAVRRGLVNPNWYVANFELGNEIISGTGTTWVRHFSVELE
jgi:Glycosyl hydrolase family 12